MTAANPALFKASLRYWNLQSLKIQILHRLQAYDATADLDQDSLRELNWWIASMASQIRRYILTLDTENLAIKSDVSLLGWSTLCSSIHNGGLWSPVERLADINYLELTAAMFAVKALSQDGNDSHIHLRMDKETAVAYIYKSHAYRKNSFTSV